MKIMLPLVSIPHRQAKNLPYGWKRRNLKWFQFLIGRLKTRGLGTTPDVLLGFQFLIGRLKTRQRFPQVVLFAIVSIPHRQAKNRTSLRSHLAQLLFQFLIGRLKTFSCLPAFAYIYEFQFLIGRLKTCAFPGRFRQLT